METGNAGRGAGLSRPGRPETRRAPSVSWLPCEPAGDECLTSVWRPDESRSVAGGDYTPVMVRNVMVQV